MSATSVVVIAAYLVFIGIPYLRRLKISERHYGAFAVGRHNYNWFWILCGLSATYVGGAAVLNLPSLGYTYGWYGLADVLPTSIALLISAVVLAPLSQRKNALSLGTFLRGRSGIVVFTVGLLSGVVYTLITAAQIVALTTALHPYVPIEKSILATISTIGVLAYIYIGGYESVTFTDVIQFLCMIFMYFIPVGLLAILYKTEVQVAPIVTTPMAPDLIVLLGIPLLFVPVSQDLHIRLHSARSLNDSRYGTLLAGVAYLLFGIISVGIGVLLAKHGVYLASPDDAVPEFLRITFGGMSFIPTIAILAVILSTLDSMIFAASAAIGYEVWDTLFHRNEDEDSHSAQRASIIISAIALFIALQAPRILALILPALVIYIAVLLPLLLAFVLKVDERKAAITALITLVVVAVLEAFSISIPYRVFVYTAIHSLAVICMRTWKYIIGGSRGNPT